MQTCSSSRWITLWHFARRALVDYILSITEIFLYLIFSRERAGDFFAPERNERSAANIHHDEATAPAQSKSRASRRACHSQWLTLSFAQRNFPRGKTTINRFKKSDLGVQITEKTHHGNFLPLSSCSSPIRRRQQNAHYRHCIYI